MKITKVQSNGQNLFLIIPKEFEKKMSLKKTNNVLWELHETKKTITIKKV